MSLQKMIHWLLWAVSFKNYFLSTMDAPEDATNVYTPRCQEHGIQLKKKVVPTWNGLKQGFWIIILAILATHNQLDK